MIRDYIDMKFKYGDCILSCEYTEAIIDEIEKLEYQLIGRYRYKKQSLIIKYKDKYIYLDAEFYVNNIVIYDENYIPREEIKIVVLNNKYEKKPFIDHTYILDDNIIRYEYYTDDEYCLKCDIKKTISNTKKIVENYPKYIEKKEISNYMYRHYGEMEHNKLVQEAATWFKEHKKDTMLTISFHEFMEYINNNLTDNNVIIEEKTNEIKVKLLTLNK